MKKLSLTVFSFIMLLIGCAEKPKNIGNNDLLINPNDIYAIVDTVFTSTSDKSYRVAYAPGFGNTNLAGRLSNNDESIALYHFIPGKTIDSLKDAQIDTVELSLYVNYRLPPTPQPFPSKIEFDVLKIEKLWSQSTFTFDSLPSPNIFAYSILGTFKDSMNYGQTVIAQLNKDYIRRWADSYIDTGIHDQYYGFTVQSRSVPTGLIGFEPFNSYSGNYPKLVIKYTKNGTRDSVVIISGEDTFVTKFDNTPTFSPITVHAAFGVRSKINFDIRALTNKPTINRAVFELTLDTAASMFSGYSPDTVIALLGMDSSIVDRSDSTIYVFGYRNKNVANQSPVYSFVVSNIVQRWVNGLKPNYGLTLRWAAEFSSAEKAVFFSSTAADTTKRPRIKITYSKK
jgi:hypothetical protein